MTIFQWLALIGIVAAVIWLCVGFWAAGAMFLFLLYGILIISTPKGDVISYRKWEDKQ